MCGITGFYSFNKSFGKNDLLLMNNALTYRGPDAEGYYIENNVGIAHRRLSIIDLSSNANLPMTSHCGRYVIVYNGEVYNFKEIREKLINTFNTQFYTSSDSEVVLEAYARWGTDFINMLNGMFAIAIYDKISGKLLLVRDRLGVKPLFYFFDGKVFAFASELKALFKLKYINDRKQINYNSISDFLHLGFIPQPSTFYNNMFKFPSGYFAYVNMSVNAENEFGSQSIDYQHDLSDKISLDFKAYWSPESKITKNTISDYSTAKEQLKELIISSVNYRMISDVPFGTFLSGGIDSSLVTAVAQSLSANPVKTFSIGFRESKFDETVYARRTSEFLKTEHTELYVTEKDAQNIIPDFLELYDEPFADTSAIPTMLVSKLARQSVTMILSGEGGDELFYGYGFYKWADRLSKPMIKMSGKYIYQFLKNIPDNKYRRASYMFMQHNHQRVKSHIFSQEQYYFTREEIDSLVNNDYSTRFSFMENICQLDRELSPVEKQALFDLNLYLRDDLLTKYDRASMKYSLEGRVPLLDYRIVEFALNLSQSLKINKDVSKYILKEVLYDYIPRAYFNRPKWGFSIPLNKWLKTDLRYLINEYLNDGRIKKQGVINPEYVKNLVDQYLNGREYLYNRIWLLIVLSSYLQP
ncbi:MAG: asparagine synthase (glutamine-hydrolyzing) [Bacteroidota bacterium]|nr:asparagine synthase (glutamine-hydrolyzing) [Bacteroidota bacterium]